MKKFLVILGVAMSLSSFGFALTQKLVAPHVGPEFVAEEVTCIRPLREGLFNISSEIKNHQLIIHDYGHGGAGWTLLFGSINRAIREFEAQLQKHPEFRAQPIRVIGAGAHGLMMAIALKKKGYKVKLVAKDFLELTSHKGAGIFAPGPMDLSPEDAQILQEVLAESYVEWCQIAGGTRQDFKVGGEFMPLYTTSGTELGLQSLIDQGLMPKAKVVDVNFGDEKHPGLVKYASIFMDTRLMIGQMLQILDDLQVEREQRTVESFDELEETVIFNCAGLGAGALAQDDRVIPVQGHLITLKNQPDVSQLKYMFYLNVDGENSFDDFGKPVENYIYFTPKSGGTLGGTYIKGEHRLDTNHGQHPLMLRRAMIFFGGKALPRDEKPY